MHSGMTPDRFHALHLLAMSLPLTAGLLLYGWRALFLVLCVVGSAGLALLAWKRVARRGGQIQSSYLIGSALLLALTLPAHLFSGVSPTLDSGFVPWPILPAAGILLVAFTWLLGGPTSGRVHPVLVTHLFLVIVFGAMLESSTVLRPGAMFTGDVLDAPPVDTTSFGEVAPASRRDPWIHSGGPDTIVAPRTDAATVLQPESTAALRAEPAARALIAFTSARESPERAWTSLIGLLRDRLPPLEDLIIGGNPGPIGNTSAVAVIVGGLFLIYRGLIDYRIPLLILLSAFCAFLVFPVPVLITENDSQFIWLAARHADVGWATAVTFANYELLAGPLMLTAFFIATAPSIRPMTRRGRTIYAVLVGLLAAFFQLYMNVSYGPYIGLLLASLLTPMLDTWIKPRTLV